MEKARRTPKQERSRSLVDAIVSAASHILNSVGLERSTTTRIAERAGVSIGSLYQYFEDRDALIGAVAERRVAENLRRFEEELEAAGAVSAEEMIHRLIEIGLERFLGQRRLYAGLLRHAPIRDRTRLVIALRRRARAVLERALERHADLLAPVDKRVASLLLLDGFMGVVLTVLLDDEIEIDRAALHEELFQLYAGYLLREPPARGALRR